MNIWNMFHIFLRTNLSLRNKKNKGFQENMLRLIYLLVTNNYSAKWIINQFIIRGLKKKYISFFSGHEEHVPHLFNIHF